MKEQNPSSDACKAASEVEGTGVRNNAEKSSDGSFFVVRMQEHTDRARRIRARRVQPNHKAAGCSNDPMLSGLP